MNLHENVIKSNGKRVLLYSGGMDSFIISRIEEFDTLLYVDIGSKYSKIETQFIKKYNPEVIIDKRLDLSDMELDNSIVPLRNLFFAMIGTYYGDNITLGATSGDRSFDKDETFGNKASDILSYIYGQSWWNEGRKIEIDLKYKKYTKTELLKQYIEKGNSIDDLVNKSFSCYFPVKSGKTSKPCGVCKPCLRKWIHLLPYIDIRNTFETDPYEAGLALINKTKLNIDTPLSRGKEDYELVKNWESHFGHLS